MSDIEVSPYLEKLLFCENPTPGVNYRYEPTTGGINVDRLVNSKPYWADIQANDVRKRKKLIISDWSVHYDYLGIQKDSIPFRDRRLWAQFLAQGNEIYVWTGELTKVTNLRELTKALQQVELIAVNELTDELTKNNISKHESEIIDYQRKHEILKEMSLSHSTLSSIDLSIFQSYPDHVFKKLLASLRKDVPINIIVNEGTEHFLNALIEANFKIEYIQLSEDASENFTQFCKNKNPNWLKHVKEFVIYDDNCTYANFKTLCGLIPESASLKYRSETLSLYSEFSEDSYVIPQHFRLNLNGPSITDALVSKLLGNTPNVTLLELKKSAIGEFAEHVPQMNELTELFIDGIDINDEQLANLLNHCPNIEKLHVKNCKNISGLFFSKLKIGSKLSDIQLGGTNISQTYLLQFLSRAPLIKTLGLGENLKDTVNITDNKHAFKNLRILTLQGKKAEYNQVDLDNLLSCTPGLVELAISNKNVDSLKPQLTKLVDLESLVLDSTIDTTNSQSLFVNLPKLTALAFRKVETTIDFIEDFLSRAPNLQTMTFEGSIFIPANFSNRNNQASSQKLTHLKLQGEYNLQVLNYFLSSAPNLKELEMAAPNPDTKLMDIPNLKTIEDLFISSDISAEQLLILLNHAPNLKKLTIKGIIGDISPGLLNTLGKLQILHLQSDITAENFTTLLNATKNLKDLQIDKDIEGSISSIPKLPLTHLEHLMISKLKDINSETHPTKLLNSIDAHCSATTLNVDCNLANKLDFLVNQQAELKNIKLDVDTLKIDRYDNASLTDEQLAFVLAHCPTLKRLTLSHCPLLKGEILEHPQYFTSLKEIIFEDIDFHIKGNVLKNIVLANPKIKIELDRNEQLNLLKDPDLDPTILANIHFTEVDLAYVVPSGQHFKDILTHVPHAEKLVIGDIKGEIPFATDFVHPGIKRFEVKWSDCNVDRLIQIVSHLPNIDHITIEHSSLSAAQIFKLILHCKNLRSISADILKPNEIIELLSVFPDLEINGKRYDASEQLQLDNNNNRKMLETKPSSSKKSQSAGFDTNAVKPDESLDIQEYFEKKNNGDPSPGGYRLGVYPELIIAEEIKYSSASYPINTLQVVNNRKDLHQVYDATYKNNPSVFFAQLELTPDGNEWLQLPSLSSNDKILDLAATAPVQLGYCAETALYYVRPLTPSNFPLSVSFLLESDLKPYLTKVTAKNLNFKSLTFGQDGKLIKDDAYQHIMSEIKNLSSDELISSLANFCKNSQEGKLEGEFKNHIEQLNALLHADPRIGACRHNTWLFMALAQELNVEARAILNDCHAFVEVKSNSEWFHIDLGGIEAELRPKPMPKSPLTQSAQPILIPTENNPFRTWDTLKSNAQSYEDYCKEILAAANKLPAGKKNMLIVLDKDQIETFHAAMTKYMHESKYEFIFLNSLSDVNEKEAIVENGQLRTPTSHLINFAEKAKDSDVLISNWSDYRPIYIGYNSMFDDDRKLKSHAISGNLTLISVLEKNKMGDMGEDFYSRFRIVSECPELSQKENIVEKCKHHAKELSENIAQIEFFDGDWQSLLLGKVHINGQHFTLKEGALVKAIKEGNSALLLQNAPWENQEFRLFVSELLYKRSFNFNGNTISLPENFVIAAADKTPVLKSNLIQPGDEKTPENQLIVLNSQTFKYFLQFIHCENEELFIEPGLIEQYSGQVLSLCVSETLPEKIWAHLIHLAETHQCTLKLTLAPNVSLPEGMSLFEDKLPTISAHSDQMKLITTNDLELAEEDMLAKHPDATVLSINRMLDFNDLIEKPVKISGEDENQIRFKSLTSKIWEDLFNSEAKTIILKGTLSPILARQLESLFMEPPYLWVNGTKQYLKGKLIIVSDQPNTLSLAPAEEKIYEEKDYWEKFDAKYNDKDFYKKFKSTLEQLKLAHGELSFSYIQLSTMLDKLARGSITNPFKPYFRLDPANPILASAKRLWEKEKKPKEEDVLKRRHQKITRELDYSPYLFVVGPSGVGKSTYILTELKKDKKDVLVGIENIKKWLSAGQDNDAILFIDEANLEKEGTWDILEGLFNKTPGILLDGQFYPLNQHHKVIFAGNFSHFAGRHHHRYFTRHGQIISFKELPNEVLSESIIRPSLFATLPTLSSDKQQKINETLLTLYHKINTDLPDHPLTPRNLKMICLRLRELQENHNAIFKNDIKSALNTAILEELSGLLNKEQKANIKQWLNVDTKPAKLSREKNKQELEKKLKQFVVTDSRVKPLHILHKQFTMREMILNQPDMSDFTIPSILIEGSPGIGKSRMVIEYLKAQGFQPGKIDTSINTADNNADTSKQYYHLTPTDPEKMQAILLKAFHEGAVVIIDELNSLPLERLMNQLLSGFDLDGNEAKKKGFMVVATQNPISFTGRQVLSTALLNRCTKIDLKEYPVEELREITHKICGNTLIADKIVDDYLSAKIYAQLNQKKPAPTPRDLFAYLSTQGFKLTPVATAIQSLYQTAPTFFSPPSTNPVTSSAVNPKSKKETFAAALAQKNVQALHGLLADASLRGIAKKTLFRALEEGNIEQCHLLSQAGVTLNEKMAGKSYLWLAAESADSNTVKKILAIDPEAVNKLLVSALNTPQQEVIFNTLIAAGVDSNQIAQVRKQSEPAGTITQDIYTPPSLQ